MSAWDPHNVVDPPSSLCSCSVASASLRRRGLQPTRLFRPWDFPGENTEAGCHFLLQGIFLTQGNYLKTVPPDSLEHRVPHSTLNSLRG